MNVSSAALARPARRPWRVKMVGPSLNATVSADADPLFETQYWLVFAESREQAMLLCLRIGWVGWVAMDASYVEVDW